MTFYRQFIFVLLISLFASAAYGNEDDMALIKSRIVTPLKKAGRQSDIEELIKNQNTDGSWPEVNYADEDGGNWATSGHVSRILTLAGSYRADDSPYFGDERCRNAISKGFDFWFEKDFINSNWWWNQIGVPGRMARALLLFDSDLSESQRASGIKILERSQIRMTGANLVDVAFITVMRGVLENDVETVRHAVDSIVNEIRITTDEGIQPDFSFQQHGALLYNHGYGAVFSGNCGEMAELVSGTSFAFTPEKISLLSDLLLEGTRWMVRKSTRDYGATGRGLSRRAGDSGSASYLGGIIDTMLNIPTGRETELIALREQIDGLRESSVTGNRYFWRSEIMTHHRDKYYMSARMYSERLFNTDGAHNGEGLLDHYLGDGCTYIMQSGMEYHNIFPVWDWRKIPGTTVEVLPEFPKEIKIRGTGSFSGAVSDGSYGVASFDFKREKLSAKKSWFFFDDEIVCLGTGISCESSNPVITTLNQCFLNSEVTASSKGRTQTVEKGSHALEDIDWIHHDGLACLFFKPADIRLNNRAETGSWSVITKQGSTDTIERDLFTLWLEHGARADNASYAYAVLPGITNEQAQKYASNPAVGIIENTTDIQMVTNGRLGISGIVFYKAGKATLQDGAHMTVDSPCIALVVSKAYGYDISIADPECTDKTVRVTVKKLSGDANDIAFDLPGGIYAGKTLTRRVVTK